MILAATAHAALFKAAHYLNVKPVTVPVDLAYRIDLDAVRSAVTENTLLLIGSAPQYPQGITDPIEDLGRIALERGLRLHVDACLGGFTLPFIRELGGDIPPFDLAVPGVSSISADLHKYGFAAKGVSSVLYRNKQLRSYQYFSLSGWPGGLFSSPTVTGTRPGGAIATAWAALKYIGRAGYLELTRGILNTTKKLTDAIAATDGLRILGKPQAGIFAFGSDTMDVHALADALEARGWVISQQTNPDSLHFMVTPAHAASADAFISDLRETADRLARNPGAFADGSAKLYRLQAQIRDTDTADAMLTALLSQAMTEGASPSAKGVDVRLGL
jgi:glutamate/tyrosine decarboxylase-like PLP-dependent enzyme